MKIEIKHKLDVPFLNCLTLPFCYMVGDFYVHVLQKWVCLSLQGRTTFLLASDLVEIYVSRVRNNVIVCGICELCLSLTFLVDLISSTIIQDPLVLLARFVESAKKCFT